MEQQEEEERSGEQPAEHRQEEVDETRQEILDRIADGEDGFDIIDEYGLEPDYLEDLICW